MSDNYSDSSISALKDEQQVRQKPAIMFGGDDAIGCAHSVFEIIANSVDEADAGYGENIKTTISEDDVITIEDEGRGVPMNWNEKEHKFNWELVFCTLYASGKYDDNSYKTSLGLNGLGATATQFASEFMKVISYRDKKKYTMNFKKGKPDGELIVEETGIEKTGTIISFKPDKEVFRDTDIPLEYFVSTLRKQAMQMPKVTFTIEYKGGRPIVINYPEGASGFIDMVIHKKITRTILNLTVQTLVLTMQDRTVTKLMLI